MEGRPVRPQKERMVYSGLSGKSGEKTFINDKVRIRKKGQNGERSVF